MNQQPQQQQIVHQQPMQRQQHKQISNMFCSPGALSAYRDLWKKQMQKMCHENDCENNTNFHASNEIQPSLINANEVSFSSDHQPICDEYIELEAQPTTTNQDEAPKKKKHRGPTKLAKVHARTLEERSVIILNAYGQPIGPTEQVVREYSRFLGTLARNPEFAPLNYCEWPSVPTHDKIWEYVQEKYVVPIEGKGARAYTTSDDERWNKRPKTIPEQQFKELLTYWDSEPVNEESEKNRSNRQRADGMHTMGPTSYAMLRETLKQEDPNKEEPSKAKVYMHSWKRNPEKSYKTSYGKTKQNIEQMEAIESKEHEGSNYKDAYAEVVKKPEHSGRVRLFGKVVTMTNMKKRDKNLSYIFPQQFLQSMQSQVVDQLLEANPQLRQLLDANPEVKIILPDMTNTGSNGKSPASESNGHSSCGAHSDNRLVHHNVESNDAMEEENRIHLTV